MLTLFQAESEDLYMRDSSLSDLPVFKLTLLTAASIMRKTKGRDFYMSNLIQEGDTILVNYTGKYEDGEVFDSSEKCSPLKFTVGAGQLIKGFDNAVVGMKEGDKKTVIIQASEGYGEHREDYVIEMPKSQIPPGMELKAGMEVQLMDQDKNPIFALCTAVLEDSITIDVNHPLAGKTLIFDIEILKTGLEPDDDSSGCSCCSGCDH